MKVADCSIRDLAPEDSLEELTDLLHRAYRPLLDMGLRYWATHQTVEETRRRIEGGRCLVVLLGGRIVGTVTYKRHSDWTGSDWIRRPEVATVGQFAVEPALQRHGMGSRLMDAVERIAIAEGAAELALSTAEPAAHLIGYYTKRGYRVVEATDATLDQGYRSVIMSKPLVVERAPRDSRN
jgi:GNAT superfamily N-acetyltransferase